MPSYLPRVTPLRIISVVAAALIGLYICGLSALYGVDNGWLVERSGLPRTNEYVGVRAAGEMALAGRAAETYDWSRHRAGEVAVTGHAVENYFAWAYPPPYLFVAAALAEWPFLASAFVWIGLTLAFFAWATARIAGLRAAGLWAVASPASLINAFAAHTGFWTAGAMGLGLDALATRPVQAGILLGLLSMKPQLALLVPVALVAGGYWRTIGAAAATFAVAAASSAALFGVDTWLAFFAQLGRISAHVRGGHVNMNLLVTPYGCLRSLGADDTTAIAVQAVASIAIAIAVFRVWRSAAPLPLKAATLAVASVLVSPYVFVYDLTHLSIAIGFLVRQYGTDGLTRQEAVVLVAATLMILALLIVPLPLGFLAAVAVAAVVLGRAWPFIAPAGTGAPAAPSLGRA